MPASVVRDGKLDREAAAAELRRCLDTILRTGRFHLSYRVDMAPKTAAEDLEMAEIEVYFDGPDKVLLLERNGDLLKALEHIAVRWLRLEPQLHNRVRFDCGNFRASRIAELKLSAEVAAERPQSRPRWRRSATSFGPAWGCARACRRFPAVLDAGLRPHCQTPHTPETGVASQTDPPLAGWSRWPRFRISGGAFSRPCGWHPSHAPRRRRLRRPKPFSRSLSSADAR